MRRVITIATASLAAVVCAGLLLRADMPQVPSGAWASADNMLQARSGASAASLADGRILITGGAGPEGISASAGAALALPDYGRCQQVGHRRHGHDQSERPINRIRSTRSRFTAVEFLFVSRGWRRAGRS